MVNIAESAPARDPVAANPTTAALTIMLSPHNKQTLRERFNSVECHIREISNNPKEMAIAISSPASFGV